jgi:hypothetical protein
MSRPFVDITFEIFIYLPPMLYTLLFKIKFLQHLF